jgi:hypothetical protein
MFVGLKLAFIKYRSRHHHHCLMRAINPFNDLSLQVVLSGLLIFLKHFLFTNCYGLNCDSSRDVEI